MQFLVYFNKVNGSCISIIFMAIIKDFTFQCSSPSSLKYGVMGMRLLQAMQLFTDSCCMNMLSIMYVTICMDVNNPGKEAKKD